MKTRFETILTAIKTNDSALMESATFESKLNDTPIEPCGKGIFFQTKVYKLVNGETQSSLIKIVAKPCKRYGVAIDVSDRVSLGELAHQAMRNWAKQWLLAEL